jgi:hypothetical protein
VKGVGNGNQFSTNARIHQKILTSQLIKGGKIPEAKMSAYGTAAREDIQFPAPWLSRRVAVGFFLLESQRQMVLKINGQITESTHHHCQTQKRFP